jgi:hypothetical protein
MSSSIRRSPSTRADTAFGAIEGEDAVDIAPPAELVLPPFDHPALEGGEQTSNASDFLWTPSVYNAPKDECREGGFSRVCPADPPRGGKMRIRQTLPAPSLRARVGGPGIRLVTH